VSSGSMKLSVGLLIGFQAASAFAEPSGFDRTAPIFGPFPDLSTGLGQALNGSGWDLNRLAKQLILENPLIQDKLRGAGQELRQLESFDSELVRTTRFQNFYQGLEVVGSLALHHTGPEGHQVTDAIAAFDLSANAKVSLAEALSLTAQYSGDRKPKSAPELKIFPAENLQSARLVYWTTIEADEVGAGADVLIDAHSGEHIATISHAMDLERTSRNPIFPVIKTTPYRVLKAVDACQDLQMTSDGAAIPMRVRTAECPTVVKNGAASAGADTDALQASANSKRVLDYFRKTHGRNSYDGKGSQLTSVVHVGRKFANAFWNTKESFMAYGDGDGVEMASLTKAIDVAGHEMTHGVVSKSSNLLGMGDSGALNEAFADFFGKMIETPAGATIDWAIGRKLFIDQTQAKGLRDPSKPASLNAPFFNVVSIGGRLTGQVIEKPYPDHISKKFDTFGLPCGAQYPNDGCYVHSNSTIASHANYQVVQSIGRAQAEKLVYLVMTQYLTANSGFSQYSKAMSQGCAQLYGAQSATCASVSKALAVVGL
jgi:Zn-dependent metalloprotease